MNKLTISNLLLLLAKPNFEVPFPRLPIWVVASESTGQAVYRIEDCCLVLPTKGHYNSLQGITKQDECQSRTEHLCAFLLRICTGGMCKCSFLKIKRVFEGECSACETLRDGSKWNWQQQQHTHFITENYFITKYTTFVVTYLLNYLKIT